MNSIEPLSLFKKGYMFPQRRYLLDSTLAIVGASGVTGIIAAWHLYPRIPNISIVYLLVVLPLASIRGRYSATLASVAAFLTFDFFIVSPLYTFVMYHVEEWVSSTGGQIYSSPAVANGVVYVGSEDYRLYAFTLPGLLNK